MIVLITESLMLRSTVSDGRILRDRMLSGFCVRMHARRRTLRVATSVAGKQFRMTLGYWPLMTVEDARARAMEVLVQCRRGEWPDSPQAPAALPTLRSAYMDYCRVKKVKGSSQRRYESFYRTHFGAWLERGRWGSCNGQSMRRGLACRYDRCIKTGPVIRQLELLAPDQWLSSALDCRQCCPDFGIVSTRHRPNADAFSHGELAHADPYC